MGAGIQVLCLTCGTVIQSLARHHMECCDCIDEDTQICIDGGDVYQKMSEGEHSRYECSPGLTELLNKDYENWEDENPPRQSKSSLPKMGVDGAGLKMISKLGEKK